MASFTYGQLQTLWLDADGPADVAPIAAAIALAESSGCQYALAAPNDVRPVKSCTYRETSTEFSVGLWQINTYAHTQYSPADLWDALANARAAVSVSAHGTDFTPWSTYKNRAYLSYLSAMKPTALTIPKHSTPRTQLPAVVSPPGSHISRKGSVAGNWHSLMMALGSTLPAQDEEVRRIRYQIARAGR